MALNHFYIAFLVFLTIFAYFSEAIPFKPATSNMCMTDSNCHYGDKCYKNRCWQNLGTLCLNTFSCSGYTTACFDGFCYAQRN